MMGGVEQRNVHRRSAFEPCRQHAHERRAEQGAGRVADQVWNANLAELLRKSEEHGGTENGPAQSGESAQFELRLVRTSASAAIAPDGVTISGLMSSSRRRSALSSAKSATAPIAATVASRLPTAPPL